MTKTFMASVKADGTSTRLKRPRLARCIAIGLLNLGLLNFFSTPTLAQADDQDAAVRRVLAAQALAQAQLIEADDPLGLEGYRPGFMLPLASDEVSKKLDAFAEHIEAADWGKAFRVLSELNGDELESMVPIDGAGTCPTVRVRMQQTLLSLPPQGLRAFRLYFDGQALEQFDAIKAHPLPGSNEQLLALQQLVDRFIATRVGGEAAALAGDLYFERGVFSRAEVCWRLAVEHGEPTNEQAIALQAKRVLAMHRGGESADAARLLGELRERYQDVSVALGGEDVDALAMLGETIGDAANQLDDDAVAKAPPLSLPGPGAPPIWHLAFLDQSGQARLSLGNRSSYYRGPQDLRRFVPGVVADSERVYFNYLDAVFALDRDRGKILWTAESLSEVTGSIAQRMTTNAGDPRGYRLADGGEVLLITRTTNLSTRNTQQAIAALDKQSGRTRWSSDVHGDWPLALNDQPPKKTSVLGELLVDRRWAYAVVHREGESDCFLRRFDPQTGEVHWTVKLGTADPIGFRYTEIRRMPQPRMLLGEGLLYVLMGNGAMLAVDPTAGQLAWALQMDLPLGIDKRVNPQQNARNFESIEGNNNANGSGTVLYKDGTLYAKQHLGSVLFALQPQSGAVRWTIDELPHDSKLIGIDEERAYLVGDKFRAYRLDGDRGLAWDEKHGIGTACDLNALIQDGKLMGMGKGRLGLADARTGQFIEAYENADLIGPRGGHLYRFDDLLVCISSEAITAFKFNQEPASD